MTKLEEFQKVYDNAIASIKQHQQPNEYGPPMNGLVNWMLETDANPYSYLPEGWAGHTHTAEGFASLLDTIHHAVYDDGDITFFTVNGEPRICFVWKHEENFRNYALTNQEKEMEKKYGERRAGTYDVQILDIDPDEFGPLYDAYMTTQIKRWFEGDARGAGGPDWAAGHYRKYKLWNETWLEEYKAKNA